GTTDTTCRQHPRRPAAWHCSDCQLDLCTECKPYAQQLPIRVSCPLCAGTMRQHRSPFQPWQCVARLLSPPAVWTTLTLTGLLALVTWLVAPGLLRLIATLPVLAVLLTWLGIVARAVAEGRALLVGRRALLDPDELEYGLRTLALILPFAGMLAVTLAGDGLAWPIAAAIVLAAAMPGVLAAFLLTDRVAAAMRPDSIHEVLTVTRVDYAPAAIATALAAGLALPAASLPAGSPVAAASAFLGGWLALAAGVLAAGMLRHYRRRLAYHGGVPVIDRPKPIPQAIYEPALLAADADTLRAHGKARAARLHLGAALSRYPDDPELNRRFDDLVHDCARRAEFRNHLARRLKRLVANGQFAPAADLWQRYSPELSDWMPQDAHTRYQLALELDQRGEHGGAFRVLIGLSPEKPRFDKAGDAWLEAARILADHLDDADKARELSRVVAVRDPAAARRWRAGRGSLPGESRSEATMETVAEPDARPELARRNQIG
ncbi:MAG: B-box zinc finger protein, partial [Xanthomonadales bacterium]|nr:B-box zinc finger protein [Xanthomonadales bacterium]